MTLIVFLSVTLSAADASEYFVGLEGCDETHDGLSREAPFATVQQGIEALEPGDTLTILPGEYLGSAQREGLGSAEAVTTIRAEIPGTAVLRGDVAIDGFRPVEGYRFVHSANYDGPGEIQALNELDTLRVIDGQPNVELVEFSPGTFHHDRENGLLYLSPTDLRPASAHRYSVSVNESHGLHLSGARRVEIEGLAVTGFHTATMRSGRDGAHGGVYGIFLSDSADCVVRDCRAWLNAQGIGISSGQQASDTIRGGNVIERCTAWANASRQGWGDMGGLTIFHGRSDTIRDSVSYLNAGYGTNIYNSAHGLEEADENKSRLIGNVAWGNGMADLKIKAEPWHSTERCVGFFGTNSLNPIHCLFRRPYADAGPDSIQLESEENLDLDAEFADPDNHDYRLQATSRFRGAGPGGTDRGPYPYEPNIFYVHPEGSDASDGLSISRAWRSLPHALSALPAGATLYLEAGRYPLPEQVVLPENVTLRARGKEPVLLTGEAILMGGEGLSVERVDFIDKLTLKDLQDVTFAECSFSGANGGLNVDGVDGLRLERVLLAGVTLEAASSSELHITGCSFTASPGLMLDTAAAVRYADYNAYADRSACWLIDGHVADLDALRPDHERYSNVLEMTPTLYAGAPRLPSGPDVLTGGPWNLSLGRQPASERMILARRLAGPFVHSVTDTTANLEWWVSTPGEYRVHWGETPEFSETALIDTASAGDFSLTGLTPDREYQFRIEHEEPFEAVATGEVQDALTVTFRTAAEAAESRTYFVSPDGNDTANGTSRETALRTVSRAADLVRPGDTVLVGAGTYRESVRIRATGEAGRPIVFKSAPGEKVVFDGMDRALTFAFLATDKSHLHVDGFYFTGYGNRSPHVPWAYRMRGLNGAITLYRGRDISVTRCFSDARGSGYGPGIMYALHSADLLLRNNVIIGAMGGGIAFAGCPNLRIEHNVFLRNLIANIGEGVNEPDQRFILSRNIFTDSLPKKVGGSLFNIGKIESMVEESNVYYLRIPDADRRMFMFYEPEPAYGRAARSFRLRDNFDEPPLITERTRMSLAEYQRKYNPDSGSIVADPLFQATVDWERTDESGDPLYLADRLVPYDLDFSDLFTTHPELIERGIGLQPESFEDFHFNQ